MKMNNFLYYFKNITFLGFLISFIYLLPNVNYNTVSGKLFAALIIVYSIVTLTIFIIKSDRAVYNKLGNFVTSLLHIYTVIIVFRFINCTNNFCTLDPNFLKINYIIITIVIITIFLDTVLYRKD